jgi:hypothetical protein
MLTDVPAKRSENSVVGFVGKMEVGDREAGRKDMGCG